jgi:hypothetical protein
MSPRDPPPPPSHPYAYATTTDQVRTLVGRVCCDSSLLLRRTIWFDIHHQRYVGRDNVPQKPMSEHCFLLSFFFIVAIDVCQTSPSELRHFCQRRVRKAAGRSACVGERIRAGLADGRTDHLLAILAAQVSPALTVSMSSYNAWHSRSYC